MMRTVRLTPFLLAMVLFVQVAAFSDWDPKSEPELVSAAQDAVKKFKASDPIVASYFKDAYGYVVFPTVGKAGLIVGGAHGKGVVYIQGKIAGKASISQVTVGAQIGGEAFSELMFFKDKAAFEKFKNGDLKFSAAASASVAKASAQAARNWSEGVAVFFHGKGGLIADASIGGQNFEFEQAVKPPPAKKGRGKK